MLSAIFWQSVFLIQLIQHVLDRHIFHMFRHLDRHAEPVIHFRYKVYDQEGIKPEITDQKCVFSIGVSMYASRISPRIFSSSCSVRSFFEDPFIHLRLCAPRI